MWGGGGIWDWAVPITRLPVDTVAAAATESTFSINIHLETKPGTQNTSHSPVVERRRLEVRSKGCTMRFGTPSGLEAERRAAGAAARVEVLH